MILLLKLGKVLLLWLKTMRVEMVLPQVGREKARWTMYLAQMRLMR